MAAAMVCRIRVRPVGRGGAAVRAAAARSMSSRVSRRRGPCRAPWPGRPPGCAASPRQRGDADGAGLAVTGDCRRRRWTGTTAGAAVGRDAPGPDRRRYLSLTDQGQDRPHGYLLARLDQELLEHAGGEDSTSITPFSVSTSAMMSPR